MTLLLEMFMIFQYYEWSTIFYVLIQGHTLIDAHANAAQNSSHQIHTKCLIKHQKVIQNH